MGSSFLRLTAAAAVLFWSTAAATAQTPIDVFAIGGQSNSGGASADPVNSPKIEPGTALAYDPVAHALVPANDPVGPANQGSAWPSFAATYYARTGRKVLLVPMSVWGSAQTAAADNGAGNWDTTGTLVPRLIAGIGEATNLAVAAGYDPVLRGVLWGPQGETDAFKITSAGGTFTAQDYHAAFVNMIERIREASDPPALPIFIFRLGDANGPLAANAPAFAKIRDAQELVAASDSHAPIVFRGAASFVNRGLIQADGVHYTQGGLNEMGAAGAIDVVASGLVPPRNPTAQF